MRILGLDSGALRLGWAVIDVFGTHRHLFASGIDGTKRADSEEYRAYRLRLLRYWADMFPVYLQKWSPDKIISETLPAVGGGNFVAATQSELAKAAITTCQVVAYQHGVPWEEMAANSIKKTLTGNGRATKVGVRNAVIATFPELLPRKKELTTYADESDAIGIALVGAGYRHDNRN